MVMAVFWSTRGGAKWCAVGDGSAVDPHAIQISERGTVYVADRENGRVEKFDLQGKYLGKIDQLGRCYALAFTQGAL